MFVPAQIVGQMYPQMFVVLYLSYPLVVQVERWVVTWRFIAD
jgi:uncharacterized membrane protein YesL